MGPGGKQLREHKGTIPARGTLTHTSNPLRLSAGPLLSTSMWCVCVCVSYLVCLEGLSVLADAFRLKYF